MYNPAKHKRGGKDINTVCSWFYNDLFIAVLTETINGVSTDHSYNKQAFQLLKTILQLAGDIWKTRIALGLISVILISKRKI
jgi:hypothetical protein